MGLGHASPPRQTKIIPRLIFPEKYSSWIRARITWRPILFCNILRFWYTRQIRPNVKHRWRTGCILIFFVTGGEHVILWSAATPFTSAVVITVQSLQQSAGLHLRPFPLIALHDSARNLIKSYQCPIQTRDLVDPRVFNELIHN